MSGGGILDGRVVVVTGAGRGLGRAHAIELAAQGAAVVVNDLGVALDGSGSGDAPPVRTGGGAGGGAGGRGAGGAGGGEPALVTPAAEVVEEIIAAGGRALANAEDVADWDGARRVITAAIDAFGSLDAVVNNAGVVRDRMFVNASEDEWDTVVRVHMKGHFCVGRHAGAYWRDLAKQTGEPAGGRIVNTTSGAGLLGSVGQAAYSAAKAGIVGLTLVEAAELSRYGVTANAIAPSARTRMTETVFADAMAPPDDPDEFDAVAPENASPLVAWLCSAGSAGVTGRVFEIEGGRLTLMDGWQRAATEDKGRRLEAGEIGDIVTRLGEKAPPQLPAYGAR